MGTRNHKPCLPYRGLAPGPARVRAPSLCPVTSRDSTAESLDYKSRWEKPLSLWKEKDRASPGCPQWLWGWGFFPPGCKAVVI